MATPKLNTGTGENSPLSALRPAGNVPAKQVKLKTPGAGADAKPTKKIAPKAASAPAPKTAAAPKPKTAVTPKAKPAPAPEPVPAPEVEPAPVEVTDTAAVDPQIAAEEEAARLAQEEYERQLAEYNRQMEEYNRQMAELQAAEAAAAQAAAQAEAPAPESAPTPTEPAAEAESAAAEAAQAAAVAQALVVEEAADVPTPTEKLRAAKSAKKKSNLTVAGAKKKTSKPAAAAGSAPAGSADSDMSDEEIAQREAYLRALKEEEQRKPIWKTVPFLVGTGLVVATIATCTVLVIQKQKENARIQAHIDYTNGLLRRAQEINKKAVETVADAGKKGVDISCSMKDAKALMEVVVDPFVKGENGKPRYGARAEGVAQNACLLLGLAAEQDTAIRDMIFDTMGKQCTKIKPTLFHWLLQRIALSDAQSVNTNLKKLAKTVADKKTAKPWTNKSKILSHIWECIGLRVTSGDTKEILELLKTDTADGTLAPILCNCLDNILLMMDSQDEKAKLGDEIFNTMPEKLRKNTAVACMLARACSPAALAYYKKELDTDKGWNGPAPNFIGAWGNDDILEFVMAKKEQTQDKPKIQAALDNVIATILKQDRPRSVAEGDKLLAMCFDNPYADTSGISDLVQKTDSMSTLYIGDSHPDLPRLQEELKKLENLRKQKIQIIRVLRVLSDHEWVVSILNKYIADKDENVQYEATKALEQTRENAVQDQQRREEYKKRKKD